MAGEAGEAAEACARDLRVNQQQVDLNGNRVGINRPDLQFTYAVHLSGPPLPYRV
jgi:hypothetical protein